MDTIAERIKEERERLGLTQDAFARIAGVSKPSQVRYEKGGRCPDGSYFAKLAAAGADVLYILTGAGDIRAEWLLMGKPDQKAREALMAPEAEARETVERALGMSPSPSFAIEGKDYAAIPRFDVELAAGDGRFNDEGEPIEHLAFSCAWLKRMGVAAGKAVLLKLRGNSMEPTLHDGDLVLIDRRRARIRDRRIYAFVEPGGEARVKRLECAGDQLLIRSDNPDCSTELRGKDEAVRIEVIGEVLWSGHVLK